MGKIDEMIKQMCPEGVKWVTLDKVSEIGTGSHNTQDGLTEGDYPFYTRGQEVLRLNSYDYDETAIITAGDGAGVGKVFHFVSGKYALHQRAYRIVAQKEILQPRFLYHYICNTFYDYIMKSSVSSSVTSVRKPMLLSYPIPLPPLPIQEAIVEILDKFDRLSAELQAELQARKAQYEYYRNQLLTRFAPDQQVKEYSIENLIVSLRTGLNPRQNFKLNEEGATCPYITGKDIFSNKVNVSDKTDKIKQVVVDLINKRAKLESNLILFASTGTGTVGRMAIIGEYTNDWNISETLYAIKVKDDIIIPKYLMYSLYATYAVAQFAPKISRGSVPHLKVKDLLDVKIQVPSLSEQARIVSILDKFEALVNDLSQGLPAEIEAVKEQYEYYRNKLLTF